MRKAVQVRPGAMGRVLKVRIRVSVGLPAGGASVRVADVLLQAGGTATGWVPHVTEMPWTSGVVGG